MPVKPCLPIACGPFTADEHPNTVYDDTGLVLFYPEEVTKTCKYGHESPTRQRLPHLTLDEETLEVLETRGTGF